MPPVTPTRIRLPCIESLVPTACHNCSAPRTPPGLACRPSSTIIGPPFGRAQTQGRRTAIWLETPLVWRNHLLLPLFLPALARLSPCLPRSGRAHTATALRFEGIWTSDENQSLAPGG